MSAVHPISRPTSSIMDLMKKTGFSKEEIRHLYRTFKQVNTFHGEEFFELIVILFRIVHQVKSVKNILHQYSQHYFQRVVCHFMSKISLFIQSFRMLSLLRISISKYRSFKFGYHSFRRFDNNIFITHARNN